MSEEKRKKETKIIERNGKTIKVVRYEGTENWIVVKESEKDNG